jgi:hypothetical protein
MCSREPSSLSKNQIGDVGVASLADAVRVNVTLTKLEQVRTLQSHPLLFFNHLLFSLSTTPPQLTTPARVGVCGLFGKSLQPWQEPSRRGGSHQPCGCGSSERDVDGLAVSTNPPVPTPCSFLMTSITLCPPHHLDQLRPSAWRVVMCVGELSSLPGNQIGDVGAASLADAVRVNATLTTLR